MQDLTRLNFLIAKASAIAGSNAALSRELGIHSQTVSDWKRGKTEPSIEMQERMASIAGLDPAPFVLSAAVEKSGNEAAVTLLKQLLKKAKAEWAYTSLATWFRGSRAGQEYHDGAAFPRGAYA